jgi:hypothetical protein
MPPHCTICDHRERAAIERGLLTGVDPLRTIADRHGVSKTALLRHRDTHLAERMAEVAERHVEADIRQAIDVRSQLRRINAESLAILTEAREAGNGALALQAIGAVQRQIELQAKLIDLLRDGDTVNVTVSPDWLRIRAVVLDSLAPYPEVRHRVAGALLAIEVGQRVG